MSTLIGFDGSIDTTAECAADVGSLDDTCVPDTTLACEDAPGFISLLLNSTCQ